MKVKQKTKRAAVKRFSITKMVKLKENMLTVLT